MEELDVRFDIRIKISKGGRQEVTIGGLALRDVLMVQTYEERKIFVSGLANAAKGISGLLADVLTGGDLYGATMGSA